MTMNERGYELGIGTRYDASGGTGWVSTAPSPVAPVRVKGAVLSDAAAELNGPFGQAAAAV